ncbi:class III poly(R)-hydroxyalkanoic acid synthase subunit PhaE [Thiohalocapsa marina]|uniref:Poly(3-hydroxyalkanoate) polymerase subunit PhaE n=1 Tax=Thiohalocapsa marina TaxID=424902 RepID=A0A5M8FRG1_9GAMM|nr:class III poly(R)-hydroxyalkanoic acid synthase subunit PhaE [Thiohalocapsa marina]KAA6186061.1 class III poly(R)-hydroxyalkanoic acid synthase subunit PhaE [Thiohalocapsa marina]
MSNETLFNDDWLKLQQRYWDGLAEMGRKALGTESAGASNPWQAAMDQWWKTLSPGASQPGQEFMDRLMEQGKSYFETVEKLTKGIAGTDMTQGWDTITRNLEDMQKAFMGGMADGDNSMRRMAGFWEMPLDNWQRMVSSLSPMMPGDLLRNMPHNPMQGDVERMLSAPGLGYSREEQGQYQDLIRRSMDYQRALQEYTGFFSKLGMKSVERMRDFLQAHADGSKPIDSARTLYDSWVSCCEAVYAEEVATPEYARIHGQLVNAEMALKKRMSVMVDESLGAMNMPTRSELRTLQERLQENRRENKHLRRELEMIKRSLAGAEKKPAAAAAKKAPVRKKAAATPAGNASQG